MFTATCSKPRGLAIHVMTGVLVRIAKIYKLCIDYCPPANRHVLLTVPMLDVITRIHTPMNTQTLTSFVDQILRLHRPTPGNKHQVETLDAPTSEMKQSMPGEPRMVRDKAYTLRFGKSPYP